MAEFVKFIINLLAFGLILFGSLFTGQGIFLLQRSQTFNFDEKDYLKIIAFSTIGVGMVVISLLLIIISRTIKPTEHHKHQKSPVV